MKTRSATPRLDPRRPLVIDTHELGRRPGSMRRARTTVPAPVDLGTPVIGVEPGSEVQLDLRLEAVVEGVLVSGTAAMPTRGECGRCLDPVEGHLVVDLQELWFYPGAGSGRPPSADDDDDDELVLVDELLNLEPVLRDAVVLALPMTPLCAVDCAGLCPGCGERLDDLPPEHDHEAVDPRWAALSALTDGSGPADRPDPRAPSAHHSLTQPAHRTERTEREN